MAQYAGLEFDGRRSGVVSDDGLHEVSPLSKGFDEKKPPYIDSTNALSQDRPQEKRICGFRRATFWLSIATALALALAIVAAAVGGHLAVKRGHSLDQLQQAQAKLASCAPQLENNTTLPNSTPSSQTCSANPAGTMTTSGPQASGTLIGSSENSSCTAIPMSDCPLLASPWTAVLVNNVQFNISCGIVFHGGDLLSFKAYQFEDCINACAGYNTFDNAHKDSNCSAVSYSPYYTGTEELGNCALKDATANVPTNATGIDSAVLLPS